MEEIKVSILVPAYNVEAYAEECLRSLLAQTLREIEIVWVDDGSTDGTHDVATRLAASDNRLRLFRLPEHQGVSAARNACLKEARGRYVTFVDSDDTISRVAVEHLWQKAEACEADIVTGSMRYVYADGRQLRVGDKRAVFETEDAVLDGQTCFRLLQERGCYVPMVCGNLYRTAFIRDHGLHFEGDYHEDEYFTPYALYHARRVVELREDFYDYRQREGSVMNHPGNRKQRAEALYGVGRKLKQFAGANARCMDGRIRVAYEDYASYLCRRSQALYESYLAGSRRKCLLVFSEESTASRYGVGTYIRQVQKCLDPEEWDVHTVTLHALGYDLDFSLADGAAAYTFPFMENHLSQTPAYEDKYLNSVFYYLASRVGDGRRVYGHFNFAHHHPLAALFKEKLQAFIVFTLHYTDWSFDLAGDRAWLERILAHPAGAKDQRIKTAFGKEKAFMVECCDRIIAIARHSYDMLRDLYGIPEEKLALVPNGLQDEYKERSAEDCRLLRRKYGFGEQEKLVVFAGRLDQIKGVAELMEAFKGVLAVRHDVRLVVAGNGNFQHCMEAADPCWRQVTFTGFLPKEKLYELYAVADVGVVPSIHEEFGYVAAEMLLHKVPLVAHDTTGLREITDGGRYGRLFRFADDRKDVSPLRDALLSALADGRNSGNEPMRQEGRQRVLQHYTLPLFRERLEKVYDANSAFEFAKVPL